MPKRITRVTSPQETEDKKNSFVGFIDGKPALIDIRSGIEDESMLTGEVDIEALEASGYSEADIDRAQEALETRIDDQLFGNSADAYSVNEDGIKTRHDTKIDNSYTPSQRKETLSEKRTREPITRYANKKNN